MNPNRDQTDQANNKEYGNIDFKHGGLSFSSRG
jgi:hypothetical protein